MGMPAASASPSEHESEAIEPLKGIRHTYAMSLLLGVGVLNFVDRQVILILGEPIKRDLHLADWQLGMMTGLAFGVLYTFLGIPIARAAERGNRAFIIAGAAAVWSLFTVLCGFVHSFTQLLCARVGVGTGEAGCTPAAMSLIMDYAAPEKRSSALAYYGMGAPLGGLLGMCFGGVIADAYGWRIAFLIAGGPGLLLAALVAVSLPEPRRALARQIDQVKAAAPGIGELLRLVKQKQSYWFMAVAITLNVFLAYGLGSFTAPFFLRNHSVQLAETAGVLGRTFGFHLGSVGLLGIMLGVSTGICGTLGTWCGGRLGDRLAAVDSRRYLYLPALTALLCVPVISTVLSAGSLAISVAAMAMFYFVNAIWYGPAFTAWFLLVPANMRATNSALILFVSNLVGLGIAPLLVGFLSDHYAVHLGGAQGVRWALQTVSIVGLITSLLFWRAARTLRDDMVLSPVDLARNG